MTEGGYQAVEDAFREGRIDGADSEDLKAYLIALANQPIPNDRVRHRDIIRGLTLNHILLQRHMERLDRQSARLQHWVFIIGTAALLLTLPQIWFAWRADTRESARSPCEQSAPATAPKATTGR